MTSPAEIHANECAEWRTPDWVIECARELMGNIDLDPASDEVANKSVAADVFYDERTNGLKQRWDTDGYPSRVLLNPTGRFVLEFWDKLIEEWDANRVLTAFWVGFNLDHLRWLSTRPKHPLGFYTCIPRSRIKFVHPSGDPKKNRPSCANYLTWLPDEDCNENWARFCEVMGKHGRCIRGTDGFYGGDTYTKHRKAGYSFRARPANRVPAGDGDRTGPST